MNLLKILLVFTYCYYLYSIAAVAQNLPGQGVIDLAEKLPESEISVIDQVVDLLPKELKKEVKNKGLHIGVSKSSPVLLDNSWIEMTEQKKQLLSRLIQNEGVELQGSLPAGIIPLNQINIDQLDQKQLSNILLWNAKSLWWAYPLSWSDALIEYQSSNLEISNYYLSFGSMYPVQLDPEYKSEQLYRQKLVFSMPEYLKDFWYLHFEFRGQDPDMLWYSSGVTKKVRQLTSSNVSDDILTFPFSLKDLPFFNSKPSDFDVQIEQGDKPYLVPGSLDTLVRVGQDSQLCKVIQLIPLTDRVRASSYRAPIESAWDQVITSGNGEIGFVERPLVRIVLNPKDPYSLIGRQVVYLDAESNIPFYKFVYDRKGRFWKTYVQFYTYPNLGLEKLAGPRPLFLYVRDHQKRAAAVLSIYKQRLCESRVDELEANFTVPQ